MGTTATGLPYPEPTDPVANGAADIRALAEAIGTTWQRQKGLEYLGGYVTSGAITMPAFGVVDAVGVSLGAAPWAVRVHVHVDAWFGYSGAYVNGHADLYRFVDGAVIASPTPVQATAAAWANASIDHSWTVGAGADMAFKCRYFADGGGGSPGWYDVRATYSVTNL